VREITTTNRTLPRARERLLYGVLGVRYRTGCDCDDLNQPFIFEPYARLDVVRRCHHIKDGFAATPVGTTTGDFDGAFSQ
jgi:hypothetical protein